MGGEAMRWRGEGLGRTACVRASVTHFVVLFEDFGERGGGHDGVVLKHDELFVQGHACLEQLRR